MRGADWVGRALCMAVTFGTAWLQTALYTPDNNLLHAGIQTVLSALTNTCGILAAYFFVRGKLSFDLQRLAYCAIVVNLLNFLAYWAKSSPSVFAANTAITVISYAQFVLILWPGNGGILDTIGRLRLRYVAHLPRAGVHLETRK